jgi:hypothetical protein
LRCPAPIRSVTSGRGWGVGVRAMAICPRRIAFGARSVEA